MEGGKRGVRVNIARIFDQKYNIIQDKMYNKIDFSDTDGLNEPTDACGYLGIGEHYRQRRNLMPISEKEFQIIIWESKKIR